MILAHKSALGHVCVCVRVCVLGGSVSVCVCWAGLFMCVCVEWVSYCVCLRACACVCVCVFGRSVIVCVLVGWECGLEGKRGKQGR